MNEQEIAMVNNVIETYASEKDKYLDKNGLILYNAGIKKKISDAVSGVDLSSVNSRISEVERQADASATDLLQVHADIQTNKNNISTLQGQMGTANTNITNLQKELEGVAAWLESHV